jgi:hypothetical protein
MTATKPTSSKPTSSQPAEPTTNTGPDRIGLSATQLIASGLAAMSSTVVASFFGVAGTVIGAALGSVVAVIGNAVYGYSLRRTRTRVRRTLDVAVAHRFATQPSRLSEATVYGPPAAGGAAIPPPHRRFVLFGSPKRLALAATGLFAAVLAVTTGFELASGQPLSSTVTGKHGSGLSLDGGSSKKAGPSVAPSSTSRPSGTGSAGTSSPGETVTVTVTPSGSASPTESSAPASSPSGTPAATGSALGSPSSRG